MSDTAEPSDPAEKPIFCANCGERNPRANKFCGSCGTLLFLPPTNAASAAPAPIATPAPIVSPTPAAIATPTPQPDVSIPDDPLARERELERLLTRANVERARALIRDSRKTLNQALVLAEHVSASAAAPVYEQLGDLLAAEERLDEAKVNYEKALELSTGKRPSAEKKLAEVSLRLSDQSAMERLGGVLGPSEDLVDVLRMPRSGNRHAGIAMMLSIAPGFGQFYCGQVIKAAVILGIFLISLFLVMLMDYQALFAHLANTFAMGRGKLKTSAPSTTTVVFAVIAFCAWLYSIADAPFSAAKTDTLDTPGLLPTPMGNRSGWEP
ncbi:hypothetical protein [Armatimonas sp.]|uniref:hypothetical protein n=1 Tax=Armatimonas sp. TaxID=1872638 RepID=UPI0037524BCA